MMHSEAENDASSSPVRASLSDGIRVDCSHDDDENALRVLPVASQSSMVQIQQPSNDNDNASARTGQYKPKWGSSSGDSRSLPVEDSHGINHSSSKHVLPDFDSDYATSYTSSNDDLPAFADASNKALHEETKRLELLRRETERAVQIHRERVQMMEDHLHEVKQEIEDTDGLMAAKKKEVETEQHLLAISEREGSRYNREIKEATEEADADRRRAKAIKAQLVSTNEETEKLKLALNCNQEELEQWAGAAAKKEEDNLALQRYARADEAKIKELSLSIENLTKVLVGKRALLDNEMKQTASCQMELDRIADDFKAQHGERKEFITQWQETVAAMRTRDDEIGRLSTQYAQVESAVDEQMIYVAKKREALAMLEIDKDELEQNAEATEREVLSYRNELLSTQKSKNSFLEELDALRMETVGSAQALQNQTTEQKVTQNELELKKIQLVNFKERYDSIKKRLEDAKKTAMSQERTAIEIEKQLNDRRKEIKQKDQLLQSLQDKLFKHSQEVDHLRKNEADLQFDITSAQSSYKNLSSKLRGLEDKHAGQQEILYNTEFDLQQMERKVARGLGERSDEEKVQLQARIDELEQDRESQQRKRKSLAEQRKKMQVELQNWAKRNQERTKQQGVIKEALVETELEINSCETTLDSITKRKEETMISHDVVRLDIRSLCSTLRSRVEEVYALEERRDTLKASRLEKKDDTRAETDAKKAEIRTLDDERHKCVVALNDKKVTLTNLKNRHDNLSGLRQSEDGEDQVGPVHALVATAQRRAELQREGDELDKTIRQAEKESVAMAKTLQELKHRNTKHRLSFQSKGKGSTKAAGRRAPIGKKIDATKPLRVQDLTNRTKTSDLSKPAARRRKSNVDQRGSDRPESLSLTATGVAIFRTSTM